MKLGSGVCIESLHDGIVLMSFGAGIVTPAVLREYRRQALEQIDRRAASALMVDLRPSVFALTVDDLNATLDGMASGAKTPLAMLVSEVYEPMFRSHCWTMAQAGFMRRTFMNEGCALRWCELRARLDHQVQTAP